MYKPVSFLKKAGFPRSRLLARFYASCQAAGIASPALLSILGAVLAIVLLIAPPFPWDMRLPLYGCVFIWTILRPRLALYLMAFAVPWGSLDFLSLGGLRLNSADILVGFLVMGWLLSWTLPRSMGGARDREPGNIPGYFLLALLLFLGVMLLSTTVAINRTDSFKEIVKWLEFLLLALLGSQYLHTRKQIWILICCLVVAAITQSFLGYVQAAFNLGPASFVRSASLRVYGTFDQPNPYAGYLNMILVVVLALTLLGKGWLVRVLAGISTCLIGGAFALTQSRGGQIAFLVALVFMLLVGIPRLRLWGGLAVIGLLVFVEGVIAGFLPAGLFNRVESFLGLNQISLQHPSAQDYSTAERLAHWIAGVRMYLAHPILGVGIGNYPDAYAHYYVTIFVNSLGQAHDYYINIAAETGTLGLLIYLFFIIAMLVAGGSAVQQLCRGYWQARQALLRGQRHVPAPVGWRNKVALLLHPGALFRYYQPEERYQYMARWTNERALAIGLMAALLTVCVHNLVDDLYDHSLTNLLALLVIALLRLGYLKATSTYSGHQDTDHLRNDHTFQPPLQPLPEYIPASEESTATREKLLAAPF
jgi:O-antigen ligase